MSFQSNTQVTSDFSNADLWKISARVLAAIHEWRARVVMRQTLRSATDWQLRDVGLIRQDVVDGCELPLSESAASSVRAAASGRVGNW